MLLIDKKLSEMGSSLLKPFNEENVTNIGYDLTTECFFLDANTSKTEVDLAPGDMVFVRTVETITLPNDMAAAVQLRNSRIRQGLSLTAPMYQPGHKTKVFFRITNTTKQVVHLDTKKGIGYLVFIQLDEDVAKPYNGTFQNEKTFVEMGAYQSSLAGDMTDIEKKVDSVKNIEKNVYGNVLSIMGIFIGIFSLINVNLSLVTSEAKMATLLTFNFATVGAIAFLIGLINAILPDGKNHKMIWIASGIAFVCSILVQFFVKDPLTTHWKLQRAFWFEF